MQENKKKLYVTPRVKSVKFQVENGYTCSQGCEDHEMKLQLENYKLDETGNPFLTDSDTPIENSHF